jgi:aquaporin Z
MIRALRRNWPEDLMEAALLGLFMVSACAFAALLEHPDSPIYQVLPDAIVRRILGGLAMGATAIALFFSPWGK